MSKVVGKMCNKSEKTSSKSITKALHLQYFITTLEQFLKLPFSILQSYLDSKLSFLSAYSASTSYFIKEWLCISAVEQSVVYIYISSIIEIFPLEVKRSYSMFS